MVLFAFFPLSIFYNSSSDRGPHFWNFGGGKNQMPWMDFRLEIFLQKTKYPKSRRGGNQSSLPFKKCCVSHTGFSATDTGGVLEDIHHTIIASKSLNCRHGPGERPDSLICSVPLRFSEGLPVLHFGGKDLFCLLRWQEIAWCLIPIVLVPTMLGFSFNDINNLH